MKIEVLYFDGCPHYKPAVNLVLDVLEEEQVSAHVAEVNVADRETAQATAFLGSPSIRVEGLDVEPEARGVRDYGISCRTYVNNGLVEGLPSRELIRRAIREVGESGSGASACCQPTPSTTSATGNQERHSLFMVGSVVAAIGASLCCTLPIVFALTGVSILGASAFFDSLRPYLLAVTFGLLGLAFYYAYRPERQNVCTSGSACGIPSKRRAARIVLWLVAGVVVAFAAFPYYSGSVAEFLLAGKS
ncbi:MAG: mercuric transporter MerT family protein [Bryobacteraceae bacterium]